MVTQEMSQYTDILIVLAYFAILFIIGLWSSLSSKSGVKGYFLAGRSMSWLPIGASLFSSNIGSGHFIGLAGSAAASGLGIAVFELNAMFIVVLLAWFFVPVYTVANIFTMPGYLQLRYGGKRIQLVLSLLSIFLYIFTKISADLFSGALFLEETFNLDLYISIGILLLISALLTVTGGVRTVMYTDSLQTILLTVGASILAFISFKEVGGYQAIFEKFIQSSSNTTQNISECKLPPSYSYSIIRPLNSDLPWTGTIFGLSILSIWYWCSDQVIVQKTLSAKSINHAQGGCIMVGLLKFLPLFLIVFPGMISRILYPNEISCATPEDCERICGIRSGCTNIAYIKLVNELLPKGIKGVMIAVMMSALMGSLASIFTSSSTIFTMDIWTRIRKNASDIELQIVGRLFTILLVAVSVCWIPIVKSSKGSRLFDYIQSITAFMAPPVASLFICALFIPRVNERGAFWGLILGKIFGLTRFVMEFSYDQPGCDEIDTRPNFVKKIHYLNFACILFIVTLIAMIAISFTDAPIDKKMLVRLTYWSRKDESKREAKEIELKNQKAQEEEGTGKQEIKEDSDFKKLLLKIFFLKKQTQTDLEEEKNAINERLSYSELQGTKLWHNVSLVCSTLLVLFGIAVFYYYK